MAVCRNKLIPSHTVVQRPDLVAQMLIDNLSKGFLKKKQDKDNHINKKQKIENKISATNPVVIVGGSHSAWAAAFNFLNKVSKDIELEEGSIVILHRSPIRMYYGNLEEAENAGYTVDPLKDVCPLTGRVNRYGGLRYHVNILAQSVVLTGSEKRIRTIQMGVQADQAAIKQLFHNAVLVVAAIGYAARVPGKIKYIYISIYRKKREPICDSHRL